jgi:plastocyanin
MRTLLASALMALAASAFAADANTFALNLTDKGFEPATLAVPAGQPFKVTVTNQTKKTAEFESKQLHKEKVVAPGKSISVSFTALKAGTYNFVDEYNEDKAKGTIVAK